MRFRAKFILCCFVCSSVFFATKTLDASRPLTLSKEGGTDYVIVLPEKPTPVEETAAGELKRYLNAATGADYSVRKESEVASDVPQIVLGNSKRARRLLPDVDPDRLLYDGIVIKTIGRNLVLTGHPRRGTLYAVYSFLEDAVGVRWWTSTEEFIPNKPTLEISAQNIEYAPKLIYRDAYYKDAFNGVFASRMKCNGNNNGIGPEYGGHHRFMYFVHSFFPLLPPEKYFRDHPDWYSEIDGVRKHERAQLCLTNDTMRAELTKNALESLRKDPGCNFISISQNDYLGNCQCAKCKAIDDEEGGPSGTLIRFVNRVAEDIEREFPDVWVETLAYQYTRKPPKKARPRKNVVVRLCSIECSFVQPLGTGEQNKAFREDIEGWSKIADRLFIWDYTVNFSAYMLPYPNHRVLGPNLRFFVDNNTIGLFEQGDAHCRAGDFVRLKNWVLSKLMWDPALDTEQLRNEFIEGYYGKEASPFVKEYLKRIHDRAEASGVFLRCFMESTRDWLDAETLFDAYVDMEKALRSTKDEIFRNRLRRDMMPIDLALIENYSTQRRRADIGKIDAFYIDPQRLLNDFIRRCDEFDVTDYDEWNGRKKLEDVLAELERKLGPSASPPEFCEDLPRNSWIDIQNCEFNLGKPGEWTFQVDDPHASNGHAVKMPGDHHAWAANYNLDDSLPDLKPTEGETGDTPEYCLYVAVRCDASANDGPGMTLGVYDYQKDKTVVYKTLGVNEINGTEYRWITMGTHPLKPGMNVWFAPPKRPGEVDAVYIDRIVVVREK